MKQYSKYKNSGIDWLGNIPEHWERFRLKDLGFLYGGLSGKSGDDFGQDDNVNNKYFIPFTNIFNNTIIDPRKMGVVVVYDNEQQNKVKKNDLFFLMSSEDYDGLGKCALLKEDLDNTYLNSFCKGFRLTEENVYPEFLNYLLLSNDYKLILQNEGKGFTRMNLKTEKISSFQVFLPPLSEQTSIAAYLDEKTANIDRRIELLRNKIDNYKQLRRSLISQVVTRGLNPDVKLKNSGIEWLGDVPEHWEVKRVKDLALSNIETLKETTDIYKEIKYVEIGDVEYGKGITNITNILFGEAPSRARRITHINDVIISTVRTYLKAIALIEQNDLIVSTGFDVLTPNNNIISKFLYYVSICDYFISNIESLSLGVSYPAITEYKISNLQIVVPPLTEQTAIAAYLDDKTAQIDSIIGKCEKQIEQLSALRRSLIAQAVTGQIKVC